MDKIHPETSHKVLRAGQFINKEDASKPTSVARMASLFDGGPEPKSPILSRSSLREQSPLITRKNETATPISDGSKSAKFSNGGTFRRNKVTITASAQQSSPASPYRSTVTNKAAFTKVIHVTGSGSVYDEKDERYQKVMGVLHSGRGGSNPTSPVKRPSGGGAVIKPMGMMGYGYSSHVRPSYQSSYRLATYLNKTSGSPYRSSSHPSAAWANQVNTTNRTSGTPLNLSRSKQPATPARKYDDDYSDSSDDDAPDTQSSEEGEETTKPSATTEKHPGGVYFKTVTNTSPTRTRSTSKTPPSSPAQSSSNATSPANRRSTSKTPPSSPALGSSQTTSPARRRSTSKTPPSSPAQGSSNTTSPARRRSTSKTPPSSPAQGSSNATSPACRRSTSKTPPSSPAQDSSQTTSPAHRRSTSKTPPSSPAQGSSQTTSPAHRRSTSKTPPSSPTQGSSQTTTLPQKIDSNSSKKSSSHPVAVKQPGGLYFTSKTKERPSSPTRLPWEWKKMSQSSSVSSSSKSTSDLSEPVSNERIMSKSKSTQELSLSSFDTGRVTDGKDKGEVNGKQGAKKAKITRNSSSSVSFRIEREKASSTLKRSPSGSYKLPGRFETKRATLSPSRTLKERPKSVSDMSSLEPHIDVPKCSPSKPAYTKTMDFPQSERLPQHGITRKAVEKIHEKATPAVVISTGSSTVADGAPSFEHSPQNTVGKLTVNSTAVSSPKFSHSPNQVGRSLSLVEPPPSARKASAPKGQPPTPAPKPIRRNAKSLVQLDSEKHRNSVKVEKPTLVKECPVSAYHMPVLKPVGMDLGSTAVKNAYDGASPSTSRKTCRTKRDRPGEESVSVKSRIALWKTLERKKEQKPSSHPTSVVCTRTGTQPPASTGNHTCRMPLKSAAVESATHLASPKNEDVLKEWTSVESSKHKSSPKPLPESLNVSKVDMQGKEPSTIVSLISVEEFILRKHLSSEVLGGKPPSPSVTASTFCDQLDLLCPSQSNLSSDQMTSGTLSPGLTSISSGRSTECGMQDSEGELNQGSLHLKRISSQREHDVEGSIAVEVFDQATGDALQSASRLCSASDLSADDLNLVGVFDEALLSPSSVDDTNCFDEQSLPELAGGKLDLALDDIPDEDHDNVGLAYSYHEYARLHKNKISTSSLSSDSSKPLALESIPEHDISEALTSFLESGRSSARSQREEKGSSSDSETEFKRKLFNISNTFLQEMVESITSTIATNSSTISSSDEASVRKTSAQIVAELVEKQPELSEYADNIYETIKEYRDKVSQQVLLHDSNEEPPELPPRPKFLTDVVEGDGESSPTHENYILMQTGPVSSILSSDPAFPAADDAGAYEPMVFNPLNVITSLKKIRSPKKQLMKKSPKHRKDAEKLSMEDDDELEIPESPRKRVGSRGEESRQAMKKKKKRSFFSRSAKDDSSKTYSHSLPEGMLLTARIGYCVSPESAPTPEQAEFGSSEIRPMSGSALPTAYMDARFRSNGGCGSLPHNYRKMSSEHPGTIEPVHSSESDSEDRGLSKMVYDKYNSSMGAGDTDPITVGSVSPSKVHWADRNTRMDNPLGTPDSDIYPELSTQHSLPGAIDSRRFIREPLTPPLVTKLAITTFPPKGIRFSSSDPNIHSTLKVLTASRGRRETIVGATPSPSHSLNRVDSSVESTFSDAETSSLNHSICSFDSFRGAEYVWKSPVPRKRMKSDTVAVELPTTSLGALQKERLMQHRRRGGSLPGAIASESEGVIEVPLVYADALMDRAPMDHDELGFSVNDVIAVLDMTDDDWWQGMLEDRMGWFPASWVRLRIGQESDDSASMTSVQDDGQDRVSIGVDVIVPEPSEEKLSEAREDIGELVQLPNKLSHPERSRPGRRMTIRKKDSGDIPRKLTPTQVRARCVEEILCTERGYVQHLEDIVEGFLYPCTQHPKLFDAERIETVFSNVEDIYHFQKHFLAELESRVVTDKMEDSQIGEIFVQSRYQFALYSEYCNNHPQAVNELNLLQSDSQFALFFESLRLLRNLTDISLDGFLLTPVQKICRYPLQLSELLKYTAEDHPDHPHVLAAQDAMRDVAILINERKRRMENVGMIGYWQDTIDSWKGPDIVDKSTELLHHGEMQKISKGHSQERHFFLFDHQLIYCRKEVVGGKLSYKGRINLDKCLVDDVADGVVSHNGSAVKNAWRVNNVDKGKWYVIFVKSPHAKEEWKKAFARERTRVQEDKETGFFVTDKMRRAALSLCSVPNTSRRKSMPRKTNDWLTESLGTAQVNRLRGESVTAVVQRSPTERKKLWKKK